MTDTQLTQFTYHNNFESLRKLLSIYNKLSDQQTPQLLVITIKTILTSELTWPNIENNCFQCLYFAISQMNNDHITIQLEYEEPV